METVCVDRLEACADQQPCVLAPLIYPVLTEHSRVSELVSAALQWQWNNGQTEGQVNHLKTLKRAMYGRAKLDLLRLRLIYAA